MNKTIVLAVDTAECSAAAVGMVRDLLRGRQDKVLVLHVHEFAVGRFGRIQVDCAEGEGERAAADAVATLTGAGTTAVADIRKCPVGGVARTIVSAADGCDAQMIVLGSATTHDLPHLPFGNVSLRVLHLASRPVLIVPRLVSTASAAEPVAVTVPG